MDGALIPPLAMCIISLNVPLARNLYLWEHIKKKLNN